MGAGSRIQAAPYPSTKSARWKLNASLNREIRPDVGDINKSIVECRIHAAFQRATGDRPIVRLNDPGRESAGIVRAAEVIGEEDMQAIDCQKAATEREIVIGGA